MGDLPQWALDQAEHVLPVWLRARANGAPAPKAAETAAEFLARAFAVTHHPAAESLFTGYYEPVIPARRTPDADFRHPVYALPDDPGHTHGAILDGALAGRGLELAWLADPVDRFFLMVQGSGRLALPDGELRLGYAGKNDHPYRSLGREMIARGLIPEAEISAGAIRQWLATHPEAVDGLLRSNPSWIYFRELAGLAPDDGPIGTAGVPLTAGVSLAVDPAHVPLGALVLLETSHDGRPFNRLMVAQDTGGVIKGAQRGDIYFGSGDAAGRAAGIQNAPGRLSLLVPR